MEELIQQVNPLILLAGGVVIPLLLAVINSVAWSTATKSLVAFVATAGVGVGLAYWMGIREPEQVISTAIGLYAWSQVVYLGVLRPTGVANTLEEVVWPRDDAGSSRANGADGGMRASPPDT